MRLFNFDHKDLLQYYENLLVFMINLVMMKRYKILFNARYNFSMPIGCCQQLAGEKIHFRLSLIYNI